MCIIKYWYGGDKYVCSSSKGKTWGLRESLKTYALLDSCSQGTFILERLPKRFGIKGRRISITIKTLNGEITNESSVISGKKVASSRDSSEDWLKLPDIYTKKYLPVGKEDVATPLKLKNWGHLERILYKINEYDNISGIIDRGKLYEDTGTH